MDVVNALIAALGFGFAIYQFKKQNEDNRQSTIDQNNKNWYLSVLVIPQLERINCFFDGIVKGLKDLKMSLDNNDLLLRAKEQMAQTENVSAFFTPLEASISSYDDNLRQSISELELSLQDEVTKIVGEANIDSSILERRIMEFKGKLIGILYLPIQNNE